MVFVLRDVACLSWRCRSCGAGFAMQCLVFHAELRELNSGKLSKQLVLSVKDTSVKDTSVEDMPLGGNSLGKRDSAQKRSVWWPG